MDQRLQTLNVTFHVVPAHPLASNTAAASLLWRCFQGPWTGLPPPVVLMTLPRVTWGATREPPQQLSQDSCSGGCGQTQGGLAAAHLCARTPPAGSGRLSPRDGNPLPELVRCALTCRARGLHRSEHQVDSPAPRPPACKPAACSEGRSALLAAQECASRAGGCSF